MVCNIFVMLMKNLWFYGINHRAQILPRDIIIAHPCYIVHSCHIAHSPNHKVQSSYHIRTLSRNEVLISHSALLISHSTIFTSHSTLFILYRAPILYKHNVPVARSIKVSQHMHVPWKKAVKKYLLRLSSIY